MAKAVRPGSPAPTSGQYKEAGPRGGIHSKFEITAVEGKTMPPTSSPNHSWVLVDKTKHKSH